MASRDSSKTTSRAILVITGLLVLSALAYFTTKYFSEKRANEESLVKINELNSEVLELEEKILNFQVEIEDQNMELAEKDKLLEEKYKELEAMATKLSSAKKNDKSQLSKIRGYESRISELRVMVDKYRKEIEYLKEENLQLAGEVQTLKAREGQLEDEKVTLVQQNEATTKELEETVQIASVLKTADF